MTKQEKPVLGVLGGLGPMATAYFLELCIRMTDAQTDQEHLDMVIYNTPSIPDRTAWLLGNSGESPLPGLLRSGQGLCRAGVSAIAVPCVTAHSFLPQLEKELGVPMIDGVKETAAYLRERGITRVGILATSGTVATGLFHRELAAFGMEPIVPEEAGQQTVTELIYGCVKAGKTPDPQALRQVSRQLQDRGAQVILLGCTELSLLKREHQLGAGYLDVLEVLARKAVTLCGQLLRQEYLELITR